MCVDCGEPTTGHGQRCPTCTAARPEVLRRGVRRDMKPLNNRGRRRPT